MPISQKISRHLRAIYLSFLLLTVPGVSVLAQEITSTNNVPITNLLQLVTLLNQQESLVGDIRLQATVCAASDSGTGVFVLEDGTDVEMVQLGAIASNIRLGDVIRIEEKNCLFRHRNFGTQISRAPVIDNDMVHGKVTVFGGTYLVPGIYPLTLEWFNQLESPLLQVEYRLIDVPDRPLPASILSYRVSDNPSIKDSFRPGLQAEYFEGNWDRLPDFDLLKPIKSGVVTNIDLSFSSQDEMAGLRFRGFMKVPVNHYYTFSISSSSGSLLYIGDPAVTVVKVGTASVPQATETIVGEPVKDPCQQQWISVEGRIAKISPIGKGLELELHAKQSSWLVRVVDAEGWETRTLLNSRVRITGVACGVFDLNGTATLGQLFIPGMNNLEVLEKPLLAHRAATSLVKVRQVQTLSVNDARLGLPVHIRGVITSIGREYDHWLTIQDDTRGIFVDYHNVSNCIPVCGDYYDIKGHSGAGDFAPIVSAEEITRMGSGELPEPLHPAWNELVNGSMDVQWVELQGLVTGVQSNILSMLLPDGQLDVQVGGQPLSKLKSFTKSVVSVRGVFFAEWNAMREVRVGSVEIRNATVTMDVPAPANPFDAIVKTPRDLLLFDAQASAFRRVKVSGQIVYADQNQVVLMEDGTGLRIFPAGQADVSSGDLVEVVGYPYIGDSVLSLREAILRKTGAAKLVAPKDLDESELTENGLDSTRVRVKGKLLGWHVEQGLPVLEMQSGAHLYFARLASATADQFSLRSGSLLALAGVYLTRGGSFELLLNSPADIDVLSEPSWWTLKRLLVVVGILVLVLILALLWIKQLSWLVEQRTTQLAREIREHELEAERSRIARDLHDDLGSSLTEISVLASTGQREQKNEPTNSDSLFQTIANKAHHLITALDAIVWAVDPADNSLQSLADYLCAYADEYLSSTNIGCRFKVPVSFPAITLDGRLRHELLMTVKETLNNIVRHADATEVEFRMAVTANRLDINLIDNGRGISDTAEHEGHGLKNLSMRMTQLGGEYIVKSNAAGGTTVIVSLPLAEFQDNQSQNSET